MNKPRFIMNIKILDLEKLEQVEKTYKINKKQILELAIKLKDYE